MSGVFVCLAGRTFDFFNYYSGFLRVWSWHVWNVGDSNIVFFATFLEKISKEWKFRRINIQHSSERTFDFFNYNSILVKRMIMAYLECSRFKYCVCCW